MVAHGGYGRRQLAPWSDIDLMVLYRPEASGLAEQVARSMTADLFDTGLEVGHSLRSIDDALQLSRADPVVATSLLESRHVTGSQDLCERFRTAFTAAIRRRGASVCREFVEARARERQRYGETVYLLEPNIKRSRGGLRDVHLLRWLWFVQTGVSDLDRLRTLGAISKFDHHRLTASRDFLLRVRNELHFANERAGDALHRHEQLQIAEKFGYRGSDGILPVERFMRDYFRHAGHVWFLASRLSELTTRRRSMARVFEPVLAKSIEKDYRISFGEIAATDLGKEKLRRDPIEALRLLDLARDHKARIAQETWYVVYRAAPDFPAEPSAQLAERFMEALGRREGLGQLLGRAHQLAVLEHVIPEFRETRCLLQFNQYHKFTVDEHSLRAVQIATEFDQRDDHLGEACRELKDPALLHLALLLHDLGKGRDGDHSVTGEQIAAETAERLRLDPERGRRLKLLVRQHLAMSHLAFRRDTTDPDVLADFAGMVGDAETLTCLFVLTCADMAAVGPGVLNDWKVGVLADLHTRAQDWLVDSSREQQDRRAALRATVLGKLNPKEAGEDVMTRLYESLPESFVTSRTPQAVVGALRRMQRVASGADPGPDNVGRAGVDAWGGYTDEDATLELVTAVADGVGMGVFASVAGALSSKGLGILAAETSLVADGLLLLRFTAADPRAPGNAAEANRRVKAILTSMVHSVGDDTPPTLPTLWGADRELEAAALSGQPNEVRIDTSLSDECAIIEVFTIDRVGLLYELARTLHECELVIRFAKIATSLDQVVDVFYVTRRDGSKPTGDELLGEVSRRLMAVIEPDG